MVVIPMGSSATRCWSGARHIERTLYASNARALQAAQRRELPRRESSHLGQNINFGADRRWDRIHQRASTLPIASTVATTAPPSIHSLSKRTSFSAIFPLRWRGTQRNATRVGQNRQARAHAQHDAWVAGAVAYPDPGPRVSLWAARRGSLAAGSLVAYVARMPSSSSAHLVLRARGMAMRRFFHRTPRGVDVALGIVYRLVSNSGKRERRGLFNGHSLRVLPRTTRKISGSIGGSNKHPRRVASTTRRFDPSAQQPRPLSCPLNPLSGNPSIRALWLGWHALHPTGRGRSRNHDERLCGLRSIGGKRERSGASGTQQPHRDET
jgi:hypothetical protein